MHTRHASRTHLLSKDDANFQPNHPAHNPYSFFSYYIFPSNQQEIIMNLPEIYRVWKIHWIVIWIDAFALHRINLKN